MQAERVSHEIRDVAQRLISLDADQYGNALDEYFEDNVHYESPGVHLEGLRELKKYLNLASTISFESHMVGNLQWNENDKIAKFAFARTIYLPTLPKWLFMSDEINKVLNRQRFRPIFDTELHLTTKGQQGEEGIRYVVSKVGPTNRRDATVIEKLLPYLLLRPLVTLFVLIFANVNGFFQRHSFEQENPATMGLSAVAEAWAGWNDRSLAREEYPTVIKNCQTVTDAIGGYVTSTIDTTTKAVRAVGDKAKDMGLPVDTARDLIGMSLHVPAYALHTAGNLTVSALHTAVAIEQASVGAVQSIALNAVGIASGTVHLFEDQAKDFGVPVDEYRERAVRRASDVGEWFGVLKAKAEERGREGVRAAQDTARQAGQATGRAAEQAIDATRRAVEQGAELTQEAAQKVKDRAGPTAEAAKDVVEEVTPEQKGGTSTDRSGNDKTPRSPKNTSAGHDPNAPGAPSYAQAAEQ
ncbi:uncharacterized protein I303_100140 [Kwoniella dejecticola CBS 10117]|uniref:Uncharacterized protein n=1 Tax=Kwoniella dejecticola CBS 10117 TaxID=1296121 RepID=A0A1A6AE59_9TREE|nr:uncharacterized protein I303_00140 [Kwoniella dejecticola CBS 10117]OBR88329.1 hypothetical protein I303_00140 [Kwoniella dejecticola CBS 10117]